MANGIAAQDAGLAPTVEIASGKLRGASSAGVYSFKGIPYGASTAGRNRFFVIGCRILTQPFFLPESQWFQPPSWPPHFQGFKTYSTDDADGLTLWELAQQHVQSGFASPSSFTRSGASDVPVSRWGEPALIRPRLGQGAFRSIVTDNYARRCAVTGERTLPALKRHTFAHMPITANTNRATGSFFGATSTVYSIAVM
jgi:putative restriction endonuclease